MQHEKPPDPNHLTPNDVPWEFIIRTRGGKCVDLVVGDGHDGVVELLHEVRDGLVGQERRHRGEQQVDEDEHHREDILQAGFTKLHRRTASRDVLLCLEKRENFSSGK